MTSSEETLTEKKRFIRSDLPSILKPWEQVLLSTEADHQSVEDLHSEMKSLRLFMNKDQDHHMPVTPTHHTHHFTKSSLFIILSKAHHNILLEETSLQQEKKTKDHTTHNTCKTDKEAHLDRAAQEIETE